jgi:hypothetical protein
MRRGLSPRTAWSSPRSASLASAAGRNVSVRIARGDVLATTRERPADGAARRPAAALARVPCASVVQQGIRAGSKPASVRSARDQSLAPPHGRCALRNPTSSCRPRSRHHTPTASDGAAPAVRFTAAIATHVDERAAPVVALEHLAPFGCRDVSAALARRPHCISCFGSLFFLTSSMTAMNARRSVTIPSRARTSRCASARPQRHPGV